MGMYKKMHLEDLVADGHVAGLACPDEVVRKQVRNLVKKLTYLMEL
jgi:hypothetical protein